jgi:hypothetical protein
MADMQDQHTSQTCTLINGRHQREASARANIMGGSNRKHLRVKDDMTGQNGSAIM